MEQTCSKCLGTIKVGEVITKPTSSSTWQHIECVRARDTKKSPEHSPDFNRNDGSFSVPAKQEQEEEERNNSKKTNIKQIVETNRTHPKKDSVPTTVLKSIQSVNETEKGQIVLQLSSGLEMTMEQYIKMYNNWQRCIVSKTSDMSELLDQAFNNMDSSEYISSIPYNALFHY
jgi:hypothetical protein